MSAHADGLFQGSLTALPTPFEDETHERIDFASVRVMLERQVAAGTAGVVVCGSTGEASALSFDERLALVEFTVGASRGRLPIIAGIGASDTRIAAKLARGAERAGADGLLATTPPYARPNQEGLRRHFAAVAEATRLPIALYNIPARTGVDLLPETAQRIAAEHANVVAIKEASDSLERLQTLIESGTLAVLCGEDRWIADALELGAAGVIGVVSNLVPARVAALVATFRGGADSDADPNQAPALVESIAPLVHALSLDTNPAPLKAALAHLGLLREHLRLPLVPVSKEHRARIAETLEATGVRG